MVLYTNELIYTISEFLVNRVDLVKNTKVTCGES